ncbi:MAG: Ig-like domain-containing protein, partial [Candidatus Desantisbacteria bacterium]
VSGSVSVVFVDDDAATSVVTRSISIDGGTWTTASSPYTWNTSLLPDGAHTLRIQAIDAVGNMGYSSLRTIEINNTLAGVVILEPANDAHIRGTQTIRVEAPASTYELRMMVGTNGTTWYRPADMATITPYAVDSTSQDGWTASWNTDTFTDGTWSVKAIAYGTGGTMLGSSTNTGIEVDNHINALIISTITTPTRGVLSGTTSVDADVTEAAFEYALSGGEYYTIGVDTKPPFSYSWNTYSILDGTYTIRVMAKDEVGNVASSTTNAFKVDNTSPTADITLVDGSLPGAKVVSGSVSVVFVDDDAATSVVTRSISIDGGTWTTASSPYTWNTSLLPDGAHTLRIQAIDAVGNMGYSSLRTIEINNTLAGVVILEPANDAHIRGTQTIRVEAPASTYKVEMMVSTGATWYNPTTGAAGSATDTTPQDGWTALWNTGTFTDGTWSVKAIAYGTGGTILGSSTNTGIEIDNTAGEFSILIQSTLSKTGTISVDGAAGDIERIVFEYEKDGTYLIATDSSPLFSVSWDTLGMADGTCTIVATSYDEVSNTYSTSTIIQIDNTGPVIGSISPTAGSLLNGTQTIRWVATDAVSGVVTGASQVSIDGGTWTTVATSSYTWLSASLKNAHTFQIRARDNEGNLGYSEQILVRFDNEPPHAPVLSQIPLIVGITTLSVAGSAEANATVTVYVNDVSAGVVRAGVNGTFTVDVTLTTNGTNTITADARDTFGNGPGERSEYVYVMCDVTAPGAGTVVINSGGTYATGSVLHVGWSGYTDA